MTITGERPSTPREPTELAVGEIFVQSTERAITPTGHIYERQRVAVGDMSTPEGRLRWSQALDEQERILADHPEWSGPDKHGKLQSNPVSDWFYKGSMKYWREFHVPYAEGLYPLQRLDDAGRLFPGGIIDEHAEDIFTNEADSVAIRSREYVHTAILAKKAEQAPSAEIRALSLGAGAGVPNIDATVKVRERYGKRVIWDMYDLRYAPLDLCKQLAVEAGVPEGDITTHRRNYQDAFKKMQPESVDIIDMLGLWEYLPREECRKAIEKCMELLKSGGVLVVSNMRKDRPHLDFHQRGLQWPFVEPREESEVVDIIYEAGVDLKTMRVIVPDDNVYSIVEIHKP